MNDPTTSRKPRSTGFGPSPSGRERKRDKGGNRLLPLLVCAAVVQLLVAGCGGMHGGFQETAAIKEANDLFSRGNYQASLARYEQIMAHNPAAPDRVLFEMGIINAHPGNEHKDYRRSLDCFRAVIEGYPGSDYRRDSEMMVFNINNTVFKDDMIAEQQARIEGLRREVGDRERDNAVLQERIKALEQKVLDFASRKRTVDRIVIEKKERRLTLYSQGEPLKIYKIALGGNPDGPKERQGDNKTPEGVYVIDTKNKNSHYHQALHISYPNENDRKRAKERGVAPGGDIMIHGIKAGYAWVGDRQADVDWTKGCIAVTDEEIEEIYRLTPLNTAVEIRP